MGDDHVEAGATFWLGIPAGLEQRLQAAGQAAGEPWPEVAVGDPFCNLHRSKS